MSTQDQIEREDIRTSLAVLASTAKVTSDQITDLKTVLNKHIEKEERLYDKIFAKIDKLEDRVSKAEGAVVGARWIVGFLGGLAGLALFLGLK